MTLVRTDVSEERIASIIRVTRIFELGTLAVTSNRRTLRRNTRVTRHNIPEDVILHLFNLFFVCDGKGDRLRLVYEDVCYIVKGRKLISAGYSKIRFKISTP
jgi:hypothetical protein